MRTFIKKCPSCGNYTLKDDCASCKQPTRNPAPARFSPEDHYGSYRRKLKRKVEGEKDG